MPLNNHGPEAPTLRVHTQRVAAGFVVLFAGSALAALAYRVPGVSLLVWLIGVPPLVILLRGPTRKWYALFGVFWIGGGFSASLMLAVKLTGEFSVPITPRWLLVTVIYFALAYVCHRQVQASQRRGWKDVW